MAEPRPLLGRLGLLPGAVRVQETVFALPFAYTGMVLAADGLPSWGVFLWITVAMVGARTLGMSANRLIDRHIDALNPRTAQRHLPAGLAGRVRHGGAGAVGRGGVPIRGVATEHTGACAGARGGGVSRAVPVREAVHVGGEHPAGVGAGDRAVGGVDRGQGQPGLGAGAAVSGGRDVGWQLRHPVPRAGRGGV